MGPPLVVAVSVLFVSETFAVEMAPPAVSEIFDPLSAVNLPISMPPAVALTVSGQSSSSVSPSVALPPAVTLTTEPSSPVREGFGRPMPSRFTRMSPPADRSMPPSVTESTLPVMLPDAVIVSSALSDSDRPSTSMPWKITLPAFATTVSLAPWMSMSASKVMSPSSTSRYVSVMIVRRASSS